MAQEKIKSEFSNSFYSAPENGHLTAKLREAAILITDLLELAFDELQICVGLNIETDELGGELTIFLDIVTLVRRWTINFCRHWCSPSHHYLSAIGVIMTRFYTS